MKLNTRWSINESSVVEWQNIKLSNEYEFLTILQVSEKKFYEIWIINNSKELVKKSDLIICSYFLKFEIAVKTVKSLQLHHNMCHWSYRFHKMPDVFVLNMHACWDCSPDREGLILWLCVQSDQPLPRDLEVNWP